MKLFQVSYLSCVFQWALTCSLLPEASVIQELQEGAHLLVPLWCHLSSEAEW